MDLSNARILFVDDERSPPEKDAAITVVARNYNAAINFLTFHKFQEVSLDHDLASFTNDGKEKTGYDVALWLADRKFNNTGYVPPVVRCHSANPAGRANIESVIKRYLS